VRQASLFDDLWIARMLRSTPPAQNFLTVCKSLEFFFQSQVLFTGFGRPAHTGKTMVFRSHRSIFGCIDHRVLPREFASPAGAGTSGMGLLNVPSLSFGMESPNALR
jgi:hypothetical protein